MAPIELNCTCSLIIGENSSTNYINQIANDVGSFQIINLINLLFQDKAGSLSRAFVRAFHFFIRKNKRQENQSLSMNAYKYLCQIGDSSFHYQHLVSSFTLSFLCDAPTFFLNTCCFLLVLLLLLFFP